MTGAKGSVRDEVEDKQLMPDEGAQPVGCPVYDWDDRDDVQAPVHLVADDYMASQRLAANCGDMLGEPGWVIWYGNVPEHRPFEVCLGLSAPKLPEALTEAQIEGRACIRCGAKDQPMRPTEAWSRRSSRLFECLDTIACAVRRGQCEHWRRGPIRKDDSQKCLDCGVVFVSDG